VTVRLYEADPYLTVFEARVVARRTHQGRPAVVLDRTAFFPEGGGQPWDQGHLGDAAVAAVVESGGEILHLLDAPLAGDEVRGEVDWPRRRDHMQQHHGQHLLSRALLLGAGAATVSFHLGAQDSSVDLDREVSSDAIAAAVAAANEVVWAGRPVETAVVDRAQALARGVAVPDEAGDAVRIVDVEGFDRQPCCGTHPRRTSEVGFVLALDQERYKGGTRLHFACGHRALAAAQRQGALLRQLAGRLSAPAEGAPEALARLQAQLAEGEKRAKELAERLVDAEAARLAAGEDPVVSAVYPGWEPADLRQLALRIVGRRPCLALLGSRAGPSKAHLVFAQSEGLGHDVPALLQRAAQALGGRGGGRGNVAQGGSDRADGLEAAVESAAREASATAR
jgi:alanyl-tRNA synthetase